MDIHRHGRVTPKCLAFGGAGRGALALALALCLCGVAAEAPRPPLFPALELGVEGLDAGELLLGELSCTGCHPAETEVLERLRPKPAPLLGHAAERLRPAYVRAWLLDPLATKPGTTMPGVLQGLPGRQRTAAVEDLVHFLWSLTDQPCTGRFGVRPTPTGAGPRPLSPDGLCGLSPALRAGGRSFRPRRGRSERSGRRALRSRSTPGRVPAAAEPGGQVFPGRPGWLPSGIPLRCGPGDGCRR